MPRVRSGGEDTVVASTAANETYTDAPRGHKRPFEGESNDTSPLDGDPVSLVTTWLVIK